MKFRRNSAAERPVLVRQWLIQRRSLAEAPVESFSISSEVSSLVGDPKHQLADPDSLERVSCFDSSE